MGACDFCSVLELGEALQDDNDAAAAVLDRFPVAAGHTLVIPRRHVERLEQLERNEWSEVFDLVRRVSASLAARDNVDGVNVGLNSGEAAGQTMRHAHVHVIPRRRGDVADPRGGVRWVVPERAAYWS